MPTISNINDDVLDTSRIAFVGSHVEVQTTFETPNGSPVNVTKPKATFKKDSVEFLPKVLVPFSSSNLKQGLYRTTFLTNTDQWTAGSYEIILSGYYPDSTTEENLIRQTASLEVSDIASEQTFIEKLRSQVADDLPRLFRIDDPEEFKLSDGEYYSCLELSVSTWNSTPPIGKSISYEISNFPYLDLLITGGEIYAINKLMMLEIWNTIQYNDDISFTIDRSGKLQSKWQSLQSWYTTRLNAAKKDAAIRASRGTKVLLGSKYPLRTLRALSFNKNFSFVFGSF